MGADTPVYVCNGVPGADGQDGQSVSVTPEAAGDNCAYGGQRLQVGTDSPVYVCNGGQGADGQDGQSVAVTPEAAGDNCAYGGQRLQVGTDSPVYVCNGGQGADGQDGQSVSMTPEPPGENCVHGGVMLQVGAGEPTYICNGALPGTSLPSVTTVSVTDPRYYDAVVEAEVTDDGSEMIMVRGVCLAMHATPNLHDSVYFSGTGSGGFATFCDMLEPDRTYFVRAFATNPLGTSFGNELFFNTLALTVPTLSTELVSNITISTVLSGGNITDDGGTPILGRGICWSLNPDPTTEDDCASEGLGDGSYIALATGLAADTTYHLRAYAENAQGTAYGEDRSFTTEVLPLATVTTTAASAISYTTATGGGNVSGDNGSPVSSRGICWSTTTAPTTADDHYAEFGGLGVFFVPMTGLATDTTYYVRAFAENGGGISYGNELSFSTLPSSAPVLTTRAISGISSYLAGSGGDISTDGGSAITAKGVCWSLNPGPTLANNITTDGAGPASYNSTMTGLEALTLYYVRAYATNALGTAYGNELSFSTTDTVNPGPTVPVVGTSSSTITGSTTASSGGYVSNDGGSEVTTRGVCWNTTGNPTTADTCSTDGTGLGFFTSDITGLGGCGVVYYVRAYATNSTGTGYGNQNSVSTGLLLTVTTAAVTDIDYYDAVSGGTIPDDGGCPISEKGVCWSWNPAPTLANPHSTEGPGSEDFISNITGLMGYRTYYVRAYATNSVGMVYGPQEVFVTAEPPTPYIGQNHAGGIVFYIDGTGDHGLVVTPTDLGDYPFGCEGTSIPTDTAFGTGATNTAAIVVSCAEDNIAAKIADNLELNGYSDWFLPSIDELSIMRTSLYLQGLGGLSSLGSSSEQSPSYFWFLSFSSGSMYGYQKSRDMRIRAVRAF